MKHYVLVSVSEPDLAKDNGVQVSHAAKEQFGKIKLPSEGSKKLGERVWLFERESAAHPLAQIVTAAEGLGLSFDVRYLSSDDPPKPS